MASQCDTYETSDFTKDDSDEIETTDPSDSDERETDLQALRIAAREALTKAALNGDLPVNMQKTVVDSLRARARTALGKIARGEPEVCEEAEVHNIEELKAKARAALKRACLGQEPQKAQEEPVDHLRNRVKEALSKGAKNGKLSSVLTQAKEAVAQKQEQVLEEEASPEEVNALRMRVRQALLRGASAGTLSNELAEKVRGAARRHGVSTDPEDSDAQEEEEEECDEALRMDVKELLIGASRDGRLQSALEEVKVEALRQDVKGMLSKAARDGSLAKTLQEKATAAYQLRVRETFTAAATDGRLATALAASHEEAASDDDDFDLHELQQSVRGLLVNAARDGSLQHALQDVNNKAYKKRVADKLSAAASTGRLASAFAEKSPVEDDDEELRRIARESLTKAASSGKLAQVLQLTKLKRAAKEALVDGSRDGRLAAALEEQDGMRDLRQSVRDTFVQAAHSGKLAAVLKARSVERSDEELRIMARDTLVEAARNGRRQALVELEANRKAAKEALTRGAKTGELARVLQAQAAAKAEKAAEAEAGEMNVEDCRLQARNALLGAVRSGRLASVLQKKSAEAKASKEQEELSDIRKRAKETLASGVKNGLLSKALERVKTGKSPEGEAMTEEAADVEAIRKQARNLLVNAARDGRFHKALFANVSKETSDQKALREKDELRQKLKLSLSTGAANGKLLDAFSTIAPKAPAPLKLDAVVAPAPSPVRSHRRIIGGVQRLDKVEHSKTMSMSNSAPSLTSGGKKHSKNHGVKSPKDMVDLTVDFSGLKSLPSLATPPSSRSGRRLRTAAAAGSAMAMDLDEDVHSSRLGAFQPLKAPSRSNLSLAPVRVTKSTKGMPLSGLTSWSTSSTPSLPSLSNKLDLTKPVAWSVNSSMDLGLSGTKWTTHRSFATPIA